jgi:hypothetical protein
MMTKEALHRLVEELPDDALEAAGRRLAALRDDPFLRRLENAPVDDELLADEDRAAIDEARAGYRRGEWVSNAEMKRELGL